MSDAVYRRSPYDQRPGRDVRNDDDGIFSSDTVLTLAEEGDGYLGLISLGVSAD